MPQGCDLELEAQAHTLERTHGIEKSNIERCLNSPNGLHTPILADIESQEICCSNCGIQLESLLDVSLQRNIATEVASYSPTPNFLFGKGLGTDIGKAVEAIRGPKPGGSLSRVNKRRSKGDKTPEHIMKSEENVISPETQGWIGQHIIRDQKEKEQVENRIRQTAHLTFAEASAIQGRFRTAALG